MLELLGVAAEATTELVELPLILDETVLVDAGRLDETALVDPENVELETLTADVEAVEEEPTDAELLDAEDA